MSPSDRSCRDGATVPASTNNAPSSAHHACHPYSAPAAACCRLESATRGIPAQIPVPSECRLKIEGHGLATCRIGERADGAESEHAVAAGQRDVVLQVHIDPVEIELAEVVVVELLCHHFVSAAAVRIRRVVLHASRGRRMPATPTKSVAVPRPGVVSGPKTSSGSSESAIGAAPYTRTRTGGAASEIQLGRFPVHRAAGLDDVQEVVGAIGFQAILDPDAEIVFLRELKYRPNPIHVDRCAADVASIPALTRAYPRVLDAPWATRSTWFGIVGVGIRLHQRLIETNAELHASAGGKITSAEANSSSTT